MIDLITHTHTHTQKRQEKLSGNQKLNNYQSLFPNANLTDFSGMTGLHAAVPSPMAQGCVTKSLFGHIVTSQFKSGAAFAAFLNSTVE